MYEKTDGDRAFIADQIGFLGTSIVEAQRAAHQICSGSTRVCGVKRPPAPYEFRPCSIPQWGAPCPAVPSETNKARRIE